MMDKLLLVLLTSSIVSVACHESIDCSSVKQYYIETAKNVKTFDDSLILIKKLTQIIKKNTKCLPAYLLRGDLFITMNEFQKARQDYYNAIFLDSAAIYPIYKLGLSFLEDAKYDSAREYFAKALKKKTHGIAAIDFTELDGVQNESGQGLYDFHYREIIYQLGVSYYYLHKLPNALIHFNFCIKSGYMLGRSYLYRGSIYLELGKKLEACNDFDMALREKDEYASDYWGRYCEGTKKSN